MMAGKYKLSMHKSVWRSAYTKESEFAFPETGSRLHKEWPRPSEFEPGWTRGPVVIVPNIGMKEPFLIRANDEPKSVNWFEPAPPDGKRVFELVFSAPGIKAEEFRSILAQVRDGTLVGSLPVSTGEMVWLYTWVDHPLQPHERAVVEGLLKDVWVGVDSDSGREKAKSLNLLWVGDIEGIPFIVDIALGREYVVIKPQERRS